MNEAVNIFNDKFMNILDKLCTVQTIQIKTTYTPWKTKELKELEARTYLAKTLSARSKERDDQPNSRGNSENNSVQ